MIICGTITYVNNFFNFTLEYLEILREREREITSFYSFLWCYCYGCFCFFFLSSSLSCLSLFHSSSFTSMRDEWPNNCPFPFYKKSRSFRAWMIKKARVLMAWGTCTNEASSRHIRRVPPNPYPHVMLAISEIHISPMLTISENHISPIMWGTLSLTVTRPIGWLEPLLYN